MTGRRGSPEADIQRAVVRTLRTVLPPSAIVHHAANEVRGGSASDRVRQAILRGMGVHPGFADLVVLAEGRVLFLEVKGPRGSLSEDQRAFRDRVQAQGFGWALVRSIDDALGALARHGFTSRVRGAAADRAAP